MDWIQKIDTFMFMGCALGLAIIVCVMGASVKQGWGKQGKLHWTMSLYCLLALLWLAARVAVVFFANGGE
jgi:hypothetical protein